MAAINQNEALPVKAYASPSTYKRLVPQSPKSIGPA